MRNELGGTDNLAKHMRSALAANDGGYLDESSLDFSASNGKMNSENAYQIEELGDFGFSSNDNEINSSVYWTSGNGDFSDSYFNGTGWSIVDNELD